MASQAISADAAAPTEPPSVGARRVQFSESPQGHGETGNGSGATTPTPRSRRTCRFQAAGTRKSTVWGFEVPLEDAESGGGQHVTAITGTSNALGGVWQRCSEFAMGDWPIRWVMLCSWTYIFTTAAGLVLALMTSPAYGGPTGLNLNLLFQFIYTLTYWSFLLMFVFMDPRLPKLYMLGVMLFTLGCTAFLGYYSLVVLEVDASRAKRWLSFAGAQLFLWGAAALVRPTFHFAGGVYLPWKRAPSLLWGNACFLLGSALFVHDSASVVIGGCEHRQWEAALGVAVFLVGRLFFLRGAQAPQCDWLFRDRRGGGGRDIEMTAAIISSACA